MVAKRTVFTIIALLVASAINAAATNVSGNVSGTWSLAGSPYVVTDHVTIQNGDTLTIEPGVEVKFNSQKKMTVAGTLIAEGTSGSRITFTSNQSPPAVGNWDRITFTGDGTTSVFAYVIIEYAARAIDLNTGSPSIQHNEIRYDNHGIYLQGTLTNYPSPIIVNNSFHDNPTSNVYVTCGPYADLSSITIDAQHNWWGTTDPIEVGHTIHDWSESAGSYIFPLVNFGHFLDGPGGSPVPENHVRGAIHSSTTWTVANSPYVVIGNIIIYPTRTLTIKPGVAVEFMNDLPDRSFGIEVRGTLNGYGKPDSVITFTSHETPPSPLDWDRIWFRESTTGVLDYAIVEYAQYGVWIQDASPTITHTRLRTNSVSQPGQQAYAIYCEGGSSPEITHNFISGNHKGIYLTGSSADYPNPTISDNSILDNQSYNVMASCSNCGSDTVRAENNWWGTTNASEIAQHIYDHGNGPCSGCPVVDFQPYLPQPPMTIAAVSDTPQFFKPTADGSTTISYTLDRDAYVTVRIHRWDFEVPALGECADVRKATVATPVLGELQTSGQHVATWDGRNDTGALLPFLAYGYTIEANASGAPGALGSYDPIYDKEFPVDFSDSTVTSEFNPYDNDRCEIAYYLGNEPPDTVAAWVTVTVFDMGSNPPDECRAFLQMIPRRPRNHVEYWEGRDNEGHLVGSLTYRVRGFAQGLPVNTVVTEPPTMSVTGITCRPYVFRPLFNEVTAIKYTISAAAQVTLRIFDPADQFVVTLVDEEQSAGEHTLQWDGTDLDGACVRDSGDYRIEVTLSDGNGGTVSWNGNVLVYR